MFLTDIVYKCWEFSPRRRYVNAMSLNFTDHFNGLNAAMVGECVCLMFDF